ncbi:hypothetical protein BEWA_040340 [Theileria equi strain WA]|uniref:Uncharacterized protein n=1 Tax=Theileria equi strain WA TaxID=1537102 RepID=L1LF65_THEEQ|nr:hypothetical protein BEWA_040340 [Theileria equi strain WA]EKX73996.1 hypothetical protein BEWA_040340 [Theileria equi strain WA]|eukprot:XP_004833448.1 hypothetical protein BEWA_040340 [Theileria equi strain WA]
MPTVGIDIKHKCQPKNRKVKKRNEPKTCAKHGFEASLRNVSDGPKVTDYRVCTHKGGKFNISPLKYDEQELTIVGGSDFAKRHKTITEICTYYSDKHNGGEEIEKPLALRLEDEHGKHHWYENSGSNGNNLTWKTIKDSTGFPKFSNESNPKFERELNRLTCRLHDLHFVDIYKTDNYNCACGEANVTVSENDYGSVYGYTKYEHKYTVKPNSVRYNSTFLKLKDNEGDEEMTLKSEDFSGVSVYYWNADKDRRKIPLLIEVTVLGVKAFLGNDGTVNNNDNTKWKMIRSEDIYDNFPTVSQDKLEEKLKELTCRFFGPEDTNGYCKKEWCNKEESLQCPEDIKRKLEEQAEEQPLPPPPPASVPVAAPVQELSLTDNRCSEVEAIVDLGGELLQTASPLIEFGSLVAGFTAKDLADNLYEKLKLALKLADKIICPGDSDRGEDAESGTPVVQAQTDQRITPTITDEESKTAAYNGGLPNPKADHEGANTDLAALSKLGDSRPNTPHPVLIGFRPTLDGLDVATSFPPVLIRGYSPGPFGDSRGTALSELEGGFAPQSLPEEQVARSSAPFGFIGGSNDLLSTKKENDQYTYSDGTPKVYTTEVQVPHQPDVSTVQGTTSESTYNCRSLPYTVPSNALFYCDPKTGGVAASLSLPAGPGEPGHAVTDNGKGPQEEAVEGTPGGDNDPASSEAEEKRLAPEDPRESGELELEDEDDEAEDEEEEDVEETEESVPTVPDGEAASSSAPETPSAARKEASSDDSGSYSGSGSSSSSGGSESSGSGSIPSSSQSNQPVADKKLWEAVSGAVATAISHGIAGSTLAGVTGVYAANEILKNAVPVALELVEGIKSKVSGLDSSRKTDEREPEGAPKGGGPTATYPYIPPGGSATNSQQSGTALQSPAVVDKGREAGGVTIQLDSRISYPINHSGRKMIDVTSYHNPPMKGYSAYEHMIGKDLKINKFTVKSKEQTFIPEAAPVEGVKSVIVYVLTCGGSSTPLLLYFKDKGGRKWYENTKNDEWKSVSGKLTTRSPEQAYLDNTLRTALKTIKNSLDVKCKGKKKWMSVPQNDGSNDIQDLVESRQHNNLGRSDVDNVISQIIPLAKPPKLKLDVQQGGDNNFDLYGNQEPQNNIAQPPKALQQQRTADSSDNQGNTLQGGADPGTTVSPGAPGGGTSVAQGETTTPKAAPPKKPEPASESATAAVTGVGEAGIIGLSSWAIFGASSGTLTGAGGLTGLGWWMFKRSK